MMGYLLPFTLHAHPTVHKFIWEAGVGALSEQGYGMVDLVKLGVN
jgi:CRISPR/Cas system endoribonuclease Cas6 (RAMP superfamily)